MEQRAGAVGTQNYDSGPSVYTALVQDHASAHSVNIDEYHSTPDEYKSK